MKNVVTLSPVSVHNCFRLKIRAYVRTLTVVTDHAVLWIRIRICRISMYLGLPDQSLSVIILYGSGSFHQQAKKERNPLISTILVLLFDFFSRKRM